jgi:hypothetical protein
MSTYRLVVALVPGLILAAVWAIALRGLKTDKQ